MHIQVNGAADKLRWSIEIPLGRLRDRSPPGTSETRREQ
jgi:hypothetical protein